MPDVQHGEPRLLETRAKARPRVTPRIVHPLVVPRAQPFMRRKVQHKCAPWGEHPTEFRQRRRLIHQTMAQHVAGDDGAEEAPRKGQGGHRTDDEPRPRRLAPRPTHRFRRHVHTDEIATRKRGGKPRKQTARAATGVEQRPLQETRTTVKTGHDPGMESAVPPHLPLDTVHQVVFLRFHPAAVGSPKDWAIARHRSPHQTARATGVCDGGGLAGLARPHDHARG